MEGRRRDLQQGLPVEPQLAGTAFRARGIATPWLSTRSRAGAERDEERLRRPQLRGSGAPWR